MRPNFRRDRLVFAGLFVASQLIFGFALAAQNVNRIAKREVERRQAALPRGVEALGQAQAAMQAKNYVVAHDEFRNALNSLPDAVTAAKPHDHALTAVCESGVKVADPYRVVRAFAEPEPAVRKSAAG